MSPKKKIISFRELKNSLGRSSPAVSSIRRSILDGGASSSPRPTKSRLARLEKHKAQLQYLKTSTNNSVSEKLTLKGTHASLTASSATTSRRPPTTTPPPRTTTPSQTSTSEVSSRLASSASRLSKETASSVAKSSRRKTPPPIKTPTSLVSSTKKSVKLRDLENQRYGNKPVVKTPPLCTTTVKTPPLSTTIARTHAKTSAAKCTKTTSSTNKKQVSLTPPMTHRPRTPLSPIATPHDTRRNLDKRSARLRYADDFASEIHKLASQPLLVTSDSSLRSPATSDAVRLYARKRPLFDQERSKGDFDVVATHTQGVVLYRTTVQADMKTKLVQPVSFQCDEAFDETCDNDRVFRSVGTPLLRKIRQGTAATLLMFGQTGSGKTYTMQNLQSRLAEQLLASGAPVTVQCLELTANGVKDLLSGNDNVKIMDAPDGTVCFVNASSLEVSTAAELQETVERANQRRATESTGKNSVSSRSHAIIRISPVAKDHGTLTLVDSAGTERSHDSLYHSRDRQAESSFINASLYALKECIRARGNKKHVLYRAHNLTRVLRESLEHPQTLLSVIATISPNATDFEHSYKTLEAMMSLLSVAPEERASQTVQAKDASVKIAHPKTWTAAQVRGFLAKKNISSSTASKCLDGRQVMRMSQLQLRNAFFGDKEMHKAERLFRYLREECDKANREDHERRQSCKQ